MSYVNLGILSGHGYMNHTVFRGIEWMDYTVEYDQAAICTGSKPITLDKPGTNTFSKDVFYLRTPAEANKIANKSKARMWSLWAPLS
ncbi:hypothetical protein EB796_012392 [Bugula neritina]|uniref:Uncharacterized protein n=1 Tax=Bugula neritina TaxID=10212 RepID=A0A7J7JTH7_BUGNE|nr:hypothetical protein EB796_012392 [Bugula neritina]